MHVEVEDFLHRHAMDVIWRGARVVEVGSLNVNGQARDHVPGGWSEWIGVDLIEGPGVDFVGPATEVLPTLGKFDIVVSTEVLEHDPEWRATVRSMADCLNPDGTLILTCAGDGRHPHAADGSGPPHAGEYYENVGLAALLPVLHDAGLSVTHAEAGAPGDTRVVATKP